MNLDTLELYCSIVLRQSFSRGALESGVTQAAASQAIQRLEEELGTRLLDRSKRPFTVTPEGEKFYRACRELLDRFQTVREEILADRRKVTGTVRVAAIYSVGLHDMGGEMQKFRALYPDARVRLECLHPETVVQTVLGDLADVGILSYPPTDRALNVIPLRHEAMRLVCIPSHRLADAHVARVETLRNEPFVAFDRDLPIRKAIDKVLRQRGARPEIVMEFDNVESIKKAVENGVGVSILPGTTVEYEVAIGALRALALDVPLGRPIALIHRRHKALSGVATKFIAMLQESYQSETPASVASTHRS
jgi:DNA-binding transcriptional LysR family regulator